MKHDDACNEMPEILSHPPVLHNAALRNHFRQKPQNLGSTKATQLANTKFQVT